MMATEDPDPASTLIAPTVVVDISIADSGWQDVDIDLQHLSDQAATLALSDHDLDHRILPKLNNKNCLFMIIEHAVVLNFGPYPVRSTFSTSAFKNFRLYQVQFHETNSSQFRDSLWEK